MDIVKNIQLLFNEFVVFNEYSSNPKIEEVIKAYESYQNEQCDTIIVIGGGSAIDTAKTLKAYLSLKEKNIDGLLENKIGYSDVDIFCVPTTAGTGSESTKFAVIYVNGVKYSIEHESLLPNLVLLNDEFLNTLPDYQKKCTLMDAYSQCIESMWANNSNKYSVTYAKKGLELISRNIENYLNGNNIVNKKIMLAANLSGKAINISKTTAAHAMSYKLSSLYNISHGHAVILCLPHIIEYIINNVNINKVEYKNLYDTLIYLCELYSLNDIYQIPLYINSLIKKLQLDMNFSTSKDILSLLTNSVNIQRLNNNPVILNPEDISCIYTRVLGDFDGNINIK